MSIRIVLAACEVTSMVVVSAWACLFAAGIWRMGIRCCEKKHPRPSLIATCDVLKVMLGTMISFVVLSIDEQLMFSQLLWRLIIKSIIVVLLSLPLAIILWRLVISWQKQRIADGALGPRSNWRALQASGRYNPRLRLNLDDEDCIDFRVDDETVSSESGQHTMPASSVPLRSWCVIQIVTWMLLQGLSSGFFAALLSLWRKFLPHYDPSRLLADQLEKVLALSCGEGAVGWVVDVSVFVLLAFVSIGVSDRFQRYHGRTAHRHVTTPTGRDAAEDGFA